MFNAFLWFLFLVERNLHFTGCYIGAIVFYHNLGRNVVFGLSRASFGNKSQGGFDIIWMASIRWKDTIDAIIFGDQSAKFWPSAVYGLRRDRDSIHFSIEFLFTLSYSRKFRWWLIRRGCNGPSKQKIYFGNHFFPQIIDIIIYMSIISHVALY